MKRVQEMLGLSRTTVTGLIKAGFVAADRGPGRAYRFSFQDLLLLRTAFALQEARIRPRKILRSLAELKAQLPEELPLTGLRITAVGAQVVVRDRSGHWRADTGQLLMDFEVSAVGGSVSILPRAAAGSTPASHDALRGDDVLAAAVSEAASAAHPEGAEGTQEAAYRQAIASDPAGSAPYVNLGALLCEAGRSGDAVTLYERALHLVGHDPLVHFNHAVALEDEHRVADARSAYERALEIDAGLADAHYNLGVLLDQQGDGKGALRHFNAYRRLERRRAPDDEDRA